jgi:hypothetical protein
MAQTTDKPVHNQAMYKPQRPGMRPEGMGRCGSLMASTCRSNQSFTAWLLAHTKGPANNTPQTIKPQWPANASPEDTTPQAKAHMGGNQVMGLSSSATVDREGRAMVHFWLDHPNCQLRFTIILSEISDTFASRPFGLAR